jgi:hypothetical protein
MTSRVSRRRAAAPSVSAGRQTRRDAMKALILYVLFVAIGALISIGIGYYVEIEFSSTASLIVFLALFFANFAVSWLAVILVIDGILKDAQGRQAQLDIEKSGRAGIALREANAIAARGGKTVITPRKKIGLCLVILTSHHSASRDRIIAGLPGFLTMSQSREGPDRYGALSRFDTMPSRPILQSCWKIAAPSSSVCPLMTMPIRRLPNSLARRFLRSPGGRARRSSPSSLRTSNAYNMASLTFRLLPNNHSPGVSNGLAAPDLGERAGGQSHRPAIGRC